MAPRGKKNQGRCFQTNGGMGREPWASDHVHPGIHYWQWNWKDPEWDEMACGDLEVI